MPWRPMLMPVDACTDARGVATHAAASSRTTSASMPVTAGDPVGRVLGEERPQLVDVRAVAGDDAGVEAAEGVDLVQQRGEEPDVGVGLDEHRVADAPVGRLDAARVDEHDPGAAGRRPAQLAEHVGDRVEARLRGPRVLADDEAQVGVLEVGDRVHGRRAEHGLAGDELVGAVLGARRERAAHAEGPQQRGHVQRRQRVERRRVADVGADRAGAVLGGDRAEAVGRVGHRVVPADRRPRAVGGAQHRVVEAVRVVVDVDGGEALVAGEALRHRMLAVGRQLDELPVVDVGDEPARRLADPAERAHRVHGRSVRGARRDGQRPSGRSFVTS